jgi:hypothetical protein
MNGKKKASRREAFASVLFLCSALCEAFGAIDGLVVARLEGDFRLRSAGCANCAVHFALIALGVFTAYSAFFAADGFILKPFFCVEFLFPHGENEFPTAVPAYQYFFLKHVLPFPY